MIEKPQSSSQDVVVSVRIVARPETVFRFFSDPQKFMLWMGAQSSIVPKLEGELVVGHASGPPAFGKIIEWVENRRIVFTWGHRDAGPVPAESSRVTVTFEAVPDGTLVTLRHSGLPTEADRIGHTFGWRHYASQLSYFASRDGVAGRLDALVDLFVSAWNEADSTKRAALLHECWADDGRFRDRYACVDSRDALDSHIANVLRMVQGARLERNGAIEQCHAYFRYTWRVVIPNGAVMAGGTNFAELSADGRIRNVVGFWDAAAGGG